MESTFVDQGYPLLFTLDTGASRTVISNNIFEAMKQEDQPELKKSSKLVGASGTAIKDLGKGCFKVRIGPLQLEVEAIVADIEDDGLLGVDILQNRDSGPADLMLSKGVLLMDGKEVPITQVGKHTKTRRVTSAGNFKIPAQCETVVDVHIERQDYDNFSSENDYLVQPTEHFEENYPLIMAATQVNTSQGRTCKVRMVNPLPTEMLMKQDVLVGKAVPIEGKPPGLTHEGTTSVKENFKSYRQTELKKQEEVAARTTRISVRRSYEAIGSRVSENPYQVGDTVCSLLEVRKEGVSLKQEARYEGPFLVKETYANGSILLQLDGQGKERLTCYERLKPNRGESPPKMACPSKNEASDTTVV